MSIKNKDGTVYRLSSPSPAVKEQEWLDMDKLVLHNFNRAPETLPEESEFEKIPTPLPQTDLFKSPAKPVLPEPVVVVQKEPEPPQATPPVATPAKKRLRNLLSVFCLPVVREMTHDDLYGQSYTKEHYGDKFTFQVVLLERNDLNLKFWTNMKLEKNSVVFPHQYNDGSKFSDYRWWKVSKVEEAEGGFVIDTIVSDLQPDFNG